VTWVIVILAVVAAGAIAYALANRPSAGAYDGDGGGGGSIFSSLLGAAGADKDTTSSISNVVNAIF
jgi:hypothetical protein